MKNKIIDPITKVLWLFIALIFILYLYLNKVNSYIENYSSYNDTLNELKIIDKEFDNFLLQKSSFIDYDKINKSIVIFDANIDFLNSKSSNKIFDSQYKQLLMDVIQKYNNKTEAIEYFKSQNAQLLHSIHYLYELNEEISKSITLNANYIHIVNDTFLSLLRYYVNDTLDTNDITDSIKYLNTEIKNNLTIEIFSEHVLINIKRIDGFKKIQHIQELDETTKALDALHIYLKNNYDKNYFIEKTIVFSLFVVALIILYILIIMNKRSILLREQLVGFKTAIENSYNSIVITDINSNITYVNDVAIKETGYSRDELIGQNPRVLKSGINDEFFYKKLHDALKAGRKWEGEFINKKKDGSFFYEKSSIMPIYQNGELVNYIAIKLNITDYIEEKNKVEHMAYHDSLTSLPNRSNIEKYLRDRLPIAQRNDSKIAILFIDLDRFKIINDTLGHDVGDELLIESSKRIKHALRASDILARVGGDEFIVVIEAPSNNYSAAYVCEKIIELFKEPIQTKSHLLNITLSIGVSIFPDDDSDYKKLLKYADIAMYEAKNNGKNTYRYYKKVLSIEAHNRLDMEQALKIALDKSELYMMYQPKYSLAKKEVVGLEALVRWESSTLGFVGPDKFIPVAEDTGYIIEIGLFIFEQSCKDFLIFQKSSKTLETIAINISTVQLYQDSFIHDILKITKKVGIDTKSIKLEITETHIMKNIKQSVRLLRELKELGFEISIDDFGTGHSSLSYLKLFPIDELKIDKSFVDDLPDDRNDVAIVKAIMALSQTMGYVNVAEGIETDAQEQFLKENACAIGQGYYFCKPKMKDDLLEFFSSRK